MEKNVPEFMMRVKLPSSGSFAACPSGDTEFEEAHRKAINDRLPPGFEVSWPRQGTWPRDKEGYTWVLLYLTDEKKSAAYFMKQAHEAQQALSRLQEKLRSITQ